MDPKRKALLKEVRETLLHLYHRPPITKAAREDFCGRELVCMAYEGNYGTAGWVLCVNGSPPRGTVIITQDGPCGTVRDVLYYDDDRCRRLQRDSKAVRLFTRFWEEILNKGRAWPQPLTVRFADLDEPEPAAWEGWTRQGDALWARMVEGAPSSSACWDRLLAHPGDKLVLPIGHNPNEKGNRR